MGWRVEVTIAGSGCWQLVCSSSGVVGALSVMMGKVRGDDCPAAQKLSASTSRGRRHRPAYFISKVSVVVVCFFPKNPDQVAINALPLTDSTR